MFLNRILLKTHLKTNFKTNFRLIWDQYLKSRSDLMLIKLIFKKISFDFTLILTSKSTVVYLQSDDQTIEEDFWSRSLTIYFGLIFEAIGEDITRAYKSMSKRLHSRQIYETGTEKEAEILFNRAKKAYNCINHLIQSLNHILEICLEFQSIHNWE